MCLNLITSSITITHHFCIFGRQSSKKSLLLFFIPSMNIKSYVSLSPGRIFKAFQRSWEMLVSHTSSKFFFAAAYEREENSIVVTFHPHFWIRFAKCIVEYPFAVPISRIFFACKLSIIPHKNSAFFSEILGISFSIPCCFSFCKKSWRFMVVTKNLRFACSVI